MAEMQVEGGCVGCLAMENMMFRVVGADAIDWNYGYFQGQGSQRKRVKRRLPRVRWCGKGPPNTKARRDGAFKKKWMDMEMGDGVARQARGDLGAQSKGPNTREGGDFVSHVCDDSAPCWDVAWDCAALVLLSPI